MLKKHRSISTFLILSLSFAFALTVAYSNYNDLAEADFFTRGAKFKAADLNDFLVDKQTHLDFMASESLHIAWPEMSLHRVLISSSFRVVSVDSFFSVLRC